MSLLIRCNTDSGQLVLESTEALKNPRITTLAGADAGCLLLSQKTEADGTCRCVFDASALQKWSPENPALYNAEADGVCERFGFCQLKTLSNSDVLLNGGRCFLRGYIRGIVAHEHPNMTGDTLKAAAVKNIRQAKKYGFNLVRFHSTIPTMEFVEAADEEGLFIHMEIGFAYEYNEKGEKTRLSMDNATWRETILKYRNHPSVAIFCIGNEMHNAGHQPAVHVLYKLGKELAPTKLIMDNSGWGEYDRPTADIFSQHIAYYFPFKHHADMFLTDNCWRLNGSAYDAPLEADVKEDGLCAHVRRECVPLKPVLAHEALHYIEFQDYEALNRKFDEFCAKVGPEYLAANHIKKPKYMTALPELLRSKGLTAKIPDYIQGSQEFKKLAFKVYIEALRRSKLCGFEMLQFADCLKYENKNGLVDCFDDDKFFTAEWMQAINGNAVLLAEMPNETFWHGTEIPVKLSISNFLPEPNIVGNLEIAVNGKTVWEGKDYALAGGLQKLAELTLSFEDTGKAEKKELTAVFTAGKLVLRNSWNFWLYPQTAFTAQPRLALKDDALKQALQGTAAAPQAAFTVTDTLDDALFDRLAAGETVLLLYHRDRAGSQYYWPGALERFKPCIWDRGSNLGGMIYSEYLQKQLATGRYFDLNMQGALEGAYKINLDGFPTAVDEFICGIDKPCRDRMKSFMQSIKDFIPEDTLRNFSHLFSLKVGAGTLVVCTLAFTGKYAGPATHAILSALINNIDAFAPKNAIAAEVLKKYLADETAKGFRTEDVMNHFWEIDNKPVEDTLFWEEAGIDLTKLS